MYTVVVVVASGVVVGGRWVMTIVVAHQRQRRATFYFSTMSRQMLHLTSSLKRARKDTFIDARIMHFYVEISKNDLVSSLA